MNGGDFERLKASYKRAIEEVDIRSVEEDWSDPQLDCALDMFDNLVDLMGSEGLLTADQGEELKDLLDEED